MAGRPRRRARKRACQNPPETARLAAEEALVHFHPSIREYYAQYGKMPHTKHGLHRDTDAVHDQWGYLFSGVPEEWDGDSEGEWVFVYQTPTGQWSFNRSRSALSRYHGMPLSYPEDSYVPVDTRGRVRRSAPTAQDLPKRGYDEDEWGVREKTWDWMPGPPVPPYHFGQPITLY